MEQENEIEMTEIYMYKYNLKENFYKLMYCWCMAPKMYI